MKYYYLPATAWLVITRDEGQDITELPVITWNGYCLFGKMP